MKCEITFAITFESRKKRAASVDRSKIFYLAWRIEFTGILATSATESESFSSEISISFLFMFMYFDKTFIISSLIFSIISGETLARS